MPTHACDLVKEGPGLTCPAGLPVPRGTVLARRALRSVAVLVLLALLVTAANLLWTAHLVQADNQQRCGAVVADATIPLPAAAGPARQWESRFEAVARQRALQLGCEEVAR
jgi:hypothetical protein